MCENIIIDRRLVAYGNLTCTDCHATIKPNETYRHVLRVGSEDIWCSECCGNIWEDKS